MKTLLAAAFSLSAIVAVPGILGMQGAAYAAEKTAIFAGGCFWCIEKDFEHVAGVTDVVSGYTGGTNKNPTYKNHGKYMHREAVKITFDDSKTDYATLLSIFWRTVNPTDGGGQFCDRGHSYTTAIYALDGEQIELAQKSKEEAAKILNAQIVTPIEMAQTFYDAEDYHQDYYKKNPLRYNYYRGACGRDKAVKSLWGTEAYTGVDKSS